METQRVWILEEAVDFYADERSPSNLIPSTIDVDKLDEWKSPGTKDLESSGHEIVATTRQRTS
jgi:hypothetical protein